MLDDLLGNRRPLRAVTRALGYVDHRPVQRLLDEMDVPYIVLKRERHYRPEDVRVAIDNHTKPRPTRAA